MGGRSWCAQSGKQSGNNRERAPIAAGMWEAKLLPIHDDNHLHRPAQAGPRKTNDMQTVYAPTNARDAAQLVSRWERLTLASGAVAAGLFLAGAAIFIGTVVPHMPAMDAPAAQQAAFYAQQSENFLYRPICSHSRHCRHCCFGSGCWR
jgi:hypothetical protein